MKIGFIDFWDGFDPNNNFFTHILKRSIEGLRITHPSESDLIFFSCFGSENKRYTQKKIFYTGENIRPDFSNCDFSLSFDFDRLEGKNVRLPLWYLYIDWFKVSSYGNPSWLIPVDYLKGENHFSKKQKDKFCSTVFSSPYEIRFNALSHLDLYKKVDRFGSIHQQSLPKGELPKMEEISNYKFNLCFENSVYPGYFTEKLLHAKVAGCVPIYYSDKTYIEDFNSNCCINLIDFESIDEMCKYVKYLDQNQREYTKIQMQPIFKDIPNIDEISKKLIKILT